MKTPPNEMNTYIPYQSDSDSSSSSEDELPPVKEPVIPEGILKNHQWFSQDSLQFLKDILLENPVCAPIFEGFPTTAELISFSCRPPRGIFAVMRVNRPKNQHVNAGLLRLVNDNWKLIQEKENEDDTVSELWEMRGGFRYILESVPLLRALSDP
ncbi:MAG TPA: hypothetical protein VKZ95_08730 [Sphingobacteriaceae bacterium]|nr:hypothetical protein [Sphingobacteriaceae bacterium]